MPERVNPYEENDKWYWFDETYEVSKPYNNQQEAKLALELYAYWLNYGNEGLINFLNQEFGPTIRVVETEISIKPPGRPVPNGEASNA